MSPIIKIIAIILVAFAFQSCTKPSQEKAPPNILILLADDAGWEDFGCYGSPFIKTPNIDQLATEGLKCTNAFLTTAQCSPSRISMLTGKYPHATGAEDLHMPMPDSLSIIPSFLELKNYFTGYLRKGHFGEYGNRQFDWHNKELDAFPEFLDSAGTNPFFIWVGFTDPHRPYKDDIIDHSQSSDSVVVPPYLVDDDSTRRDLARYYNYIRRMDDQIGDYLDELQSRDMLQNTLVIFLSDNGAPFPRAKGTVYDAGVKTPFVVYWPDQISPGTTSDALISTVDLAPTLLSLIEIPLSDQFQGKPITGLFDSEIPVQGRKYVFSERNWHNCDEHIRSIRSERYKLIKNAYLDVPLGPASDIGSSLSFKSLLAAKEKGELTDAQSSFFTVPRPKYELYDLEKDPYELHNLINKEAYKKIASELSNELEKWISETGDFTSEERRRKDNTDRFTGVKFDKTRLPDRIK